MANDFNYDDSDFMLDNEIDFNDYEEEYDCDFDYDMYLEVQLEEMGFVTPLYDESTSIKEQNSSAKDVLTANFYINPMALVAKPVIPKYLADLAGEFMFAGESVVSIYGESGSRKSFLLQTAVANHFGVMVQFESSPIGLRRRLEKMSYPIAAHDRYVFPTSKNQLLCYVEHWKKIDPTIIGFDSFGPMMALFEGDTNSDMDVQELFKKVFHPLRDAGHCVAFLDHQAKSPKNRGFAIGSQNKKAQVDVALRVEYESKFDNYSLYIAKDRDFIYEGRIIGSDQLYGFLDLSAEPLRAIITPIQMIATDELAKTKEGAKERKQRILEEIQALSPIGKDELRIKVGGNSGHFSKAIEALEAEGSISIGAGKDSKGSHCRKLITYKNKEA